MMKNQKTMLVMFCLIAVFGLTFLPIINLVKGQTDKNVDALYNTDVIEGHINYLSYKFLKRSTNPDNVVVGKGGDLFLGNKHNKLIYKINGEYPFSEKQLKNWSFNLRKLQNWYETKGIQFAFVVAPNKHSIYPEKLPDWVQPMENNLTDQLVNHAEKLNVHIVDLRPELIKAKSQYENLLYWRTDSHWNELGAAVGFERTMSSINSFYGEDYKQPTYQVVDEGIQPKGGHSRFLKISKFLPFGFDRLVRVLIDGGSEVCRGEINPKSFTLLPCSVISRAYLDIHRGPVYTINEQALNEKKVLILADSFLMQNTNLYNKTFETTWKHKYNFLKGMDLEHFILLHKPDVVIYQVVERSIFNNNFIDINSTQ